MQRAHTLRPLYISDIFQIKNSISSRWDFLLFRDYYFYKYCLPNGRITSHSVTNFGL